MPRLEVISICKPLCPDWREAFKQYASVPDDGRDAMLDSMLRSALLRVQEYADRAIVGTNLRLTAKVPDDGIIVLYEGGGDVTSVTDANGQEVAYDPLPGHRIQVAAPGAEVVILYTTSPLEGDTEYLMPAVYRYATALYDGEDQKTLDSILAETR